MSSTIVQEYNDVLPSGHGVLSNRGDGLIHELFEQNLVRAALNESHRYYSIFYKRCRQRNAVVRHPWAYLASIHFEHLLGQRWLPNWLQLITFAWRLLTAVLLTNRVTQYITVTSTATIRHFTKYITPLNRRDRAVARLPTGFAVPCRVETGLVHSEHDAVLTELTGQNSRYPPTVDVVLLVLETELGGVESFVPQTKLRLEYLLDG
jgi:hypothetical protein